MTMLAAALTVWTMFSLWLIAPHAQMPLRVARIAGTLCGAELVALLLWSYGASTCVERTCAPVAQAVGIAARVDIPALAAAFVVVACVHWRRAQPGP
jgi:hypothetical protein